MSKVSALQATSSSLSTMTAEDRRLGALLVDMDKLTALQVEKVLRVQAETGQRFGEAAIQLGYVTRKEVEDALARQYGYTFLEPSDRTLPSKVVAAYKPYSPFVEALRGLRSQLMLRWFDGSPAQAALAITSVDRSDGKSFITANLGVVFSQLGEKTLIIDADLRHSTQHELFGLRNHMGLSGMLSGRAGPEEIVKIPGLAELSVLPAGPVPPNPLELLGQAEFGRLLNELSSKFDVILIDTPSAQEASDALVVAMRARGALIVGRKDKTRSAEIAQLGAILRNSGITLVGATLNDR